MQITLVQDEIETAIKQYLGSIMTINEGVEVNIELAATRGATGHTALVDMVQPKAEEVKEEPTTNSVAVAATSKPRGRPVGVTKANTVTATKEEKTDENPVTVDEEANNNVDADESDNGNEPAEEKAPRTGLFSGLNRPTNAE